MKLKQLVILSLGFALHYPIYAANSVAPSAGTGSTNPVIAKNDEPKAVETKNPVAAQQPASAAGQTEVSVQPAPGAVTPTSNSAAYNLSLERDKLSYTIGVDMGQNFKQQSIDVNPDALFQGLKDALSGGKLQLSKPEMEQTLQMFQKQLHAAKEAQMKQAAQKNQQAGEAFLTENKTKKGIISLPSGLQYRVVTLGSGPKPTQDDVVTVEYTGKLLNGTVFDSTDKAGKPVSFRVSDVIPGWVEVLQLMPTGSTWDVYIPANLAYGEQGIGGLIGPNETLTFNIHLISIKKPEAAKTGDDAKSAQTEEKPAGHGKRSEETAE